MVGVEGFKNKILKDLKKKKKKSFQNTIQLLFKSFQKKINTDPGGGAQAAGEISFDVPSPCGMVSWECKSRTSALSLCQVCHMGMSGNSQHTARLLQKQRIMMGMRRFLRVTFSYSHIIPFLGHSHMSMRPRFGLPLGRFS